MTLEEYEKFVSGRAHFNRGIAELMEDDDATAAFLRMSYISGKLNGEAGEFVEEVQKSLRDSGGDFTKRREDMILELGDVMWYVTAACIELGITLDELTNQNKVKLQARDLKRARKKYE